MVGEHTRLERDSMGEVEVPSRAYYGVQTVRALANFPVSGIHSDEALVRAYARLKRAAAETNRELGAIPDVVADAIVRAADEVLEGHHHDQFVVDAFQAGAGTSFHMNVNEVLANRALALLGKPLGDYASVSPNDHVNYGQSTNDTYPTALHLAALDRIDELVPIVSRLASAFDERAVAFHDVLKAGRTHLMDAVPIRLGQEVRAYGEALRRSVRILTSAREELLDLAIGGSAVGTGLNVKPGFREGVVARLATLTGLPVRISKDLREAMQSRQAIGHASAALRAFALELVRIGNDLRLLSSGPATGLAELRLPAVQPGSSIMPAKVNPSLAECLTMICFQVVGNDTAVALAVQAGQLELNVMMPLMAHSLLSSLAMLIRFLPVFTERCVRGLEADAPRAEAYAQRTGSLGTVLNPAIGYLASAEVIKESLATGRSLREVVLARGLVDEKELDRLLDRAALTGEPDGGGG